MFSPQDEVAMLSHYRARLDSEEVKADCEARPREPLMFVAFCCFDFATASKVDQQMNSLSSGFGKNTFGKDAHGGQHCTCPSSSRSLGMLKLCFFWRVETS